MLSTSCLGVLFVVDEKTADKLPVVKREEFQDYVSGNLGEESFEKNRI